MNVTAMVTRSGGWWAVRVPEVDGAFTQVRRLDQVAAAAAGAVADLLDVEPGTVVVDVQRELDAPLAELVDKARALTEAAEAAQHDASYATRLAVRCLRGAGMSTRDVGALLELSFQRVSQLEKTAPVVRTVGSGRPDGSTTVIIGVDQARGAVPNSRVRSRA